MPHLSASFLNYLVEEAQGVDALVPIYQGRAEPLHAVYRREATISRVEEILERGGRRLMELLGEMEVRFLEEGQWSSVIPKGAESFRNLNTLEDLDESGIHIGF
jgi:molybdopterin-guanine dinucleotide biosynthesis protein A